MDKAVEEASLHVIKLLAIRSVRGSPSTAPLRRTWLLILPVDIAELKFSRTLAVSVRACPTSRSRVAVC